MHSERFASSATLQYYQLLPSLRSLRTYIEQVACPIYTGKPGGQRHSDASAPARTCYEVAEALDDAQQLDIDYDAIGHALTMRILRGPPKHGGGWSGRIEVPLSARGDPAASVEVGVLSPQEATTDEFPETMSLGGWLTVVGEDDKASACFTL